MHFDTMTHFKVGQLVLRREQAFSKLDPKASGPDLVHGVRGQYGQRAEIRPVSGRARRVVVHAPKLVPYQELEAEPTGLDPDKPDVPPPHWASSGLLP